MAPWAGAPAQGAKTAARPTSPPLPARHGRGCASAANAQRRQQQAAARRKPKAELPRTRSAGLAAALGDAPPPAARPAARMRRRAPPAVRAAIQRRAPRCAAQQPALPWRAAGEPPPAPAARAPSHVRRRQPSWCSMMRQGAQRKRAVRRWRGGGAGQARRWLGAERCPSRQRGRQSQSWAAPEREPAMATGSAGGRRQRTRLRATQPRRAQQLSAVRGWRLATGPQPPPMATPCALGSSGVQPARGRKTACG